VLASQPLTALRDRLECVSDDQPDSDSYPSGFFFIEGVFYNDLRDKRAKRLSEYVHVSQLNVSLAQTRFASFEGGRNHANRALMELFQPHYSLGQGRGTVSAGRTVAFQGCVHARDQVQ